MIENKQNEQNNMNLNVEYLETNNVQDNSNINEVVKMKKSTSFTLKLIGILIVLLIGFFIYYAISARNPEKVFTRITGYMYESAKNVIKNTSFNLDESALIKGNFKINSTIDELSELNDETYNYLIGYDIKNKKAEFGIGFDKNHTKVFTEAEIKNNNVYIYLNDIFEKTILIDDSTIQSETGQSINNIFKEIEELLAENKTDDCLYIVEQLDIITKQALKNVKYQKTNEKVKINDKEINTIKMTLDFDVENIKSITNTYVDEMIKNKDLLEKIENLIDYKTNELVESLNELKDNVNSIDKLNEKVKLSIYVHSLLNNIVKLSFEVDDLEVLYYIDFKNYKAFYSDEVLIEVNGKELSIKDSDKKVISGTANSFEFDNIDINFESENKDYPFYGSFKYINKKDKLEAKISFENSDDKFNIDFNNKKINEKEYNNKLNFNLEIDKQKFELTNDLTLLLGQEISNNVTANTVNYNELTETDINTIRENLMTKIEGSSLENWLVDFDSPTTGSVNEFIVKSNNIVETTKTVMTSISSNNYSGNYYVKGNEYCFTVDDLLDADLLDYDYYDMYGTVRVTKIGNVYTYTIELSDYEYIVRSYNDIIDPEKVSYYDNDPTGIIKTTCN